MRKEDLIVKQLAQWINIQYPNLLYHFDTGAGAVKSIGMAMRDKRINKWRGWADLFIAESRISWGKDRPTADIYCGLFIEIKKEGTKIFLKDGKTMVSDPHLREQNALLEKLRTKGFQAVFGIGIQNCMDIINHYMRLPNE